MQELRNGATRGTAPAALGAQTHRAVEARADGATMYPYS
jgi:hypothetical protein